MRVLITGGAGFIGSHLVEAGRQAGWEIRVVDDLSRGSPAHLPEDVPLIRMDIRDPALEDLVADF
ncbi:NAD-dependent epimerase/dehydratase family protein, partial [Thermoflexus hugenholtzii]